MGRPVNNRNFGATGDNTQPTIPVRYYNGTASVEGYVVTQRGTNKFQVTTNGTDTYICRLVNELQPNGDAEMSIVGLLNGQTTILQKIFNRTAVDWAGNRYTWEAQDDSTESLLILTAI